MAGARGGIPEVSISRSLPQMGLLLDNLQKLKSTAARCQRLSVEMGQMLSDVPGRKNVPRELMRLPPLPRRLSQVLRLLLNGDSEKQVAARLRLSRNTVHMHVKSIYRKLDVSSRSELLVKCLATRVR